MTDQDKIVIATTFANIVISSTVLCVVTYWTSKWNDKRSLNEQLDAIIKLSIDNFFFEDSKFTKSWRSNFEGDNDEERLLKYEAYCSLLFNYLSRLCKYHNYNKKKIENDLAIKSWVKLHEKYWRETSNENVDAYDNKFMKLINGYIN